MGRWCRDPTGSVGGRSTPASSWPASVRRAWPSPSPGPRSATCASSRAARRRYRSAVAGALDVAVEPCLAMPAGGDSRRHEPSVRSVAEVRDNRPVPVGLGSFWPAGVLILELDDLPVHLIAVQGHPRLDKAVSGRARVVADRDGHLCVGLFAEGHRVGAPLLADLTLYQEGGLLGLGPLACPIHDVTLECFRWPGVAAGRSAPTQEECTERGRGDPVPHCHHSTLQGGRKAPQPERGDTNSPSYNRLHHPATTVAASSVRSGSCR